jgi:hypothetical protein
MMTSYPATGPVHLRLRLPSGRIEVRTRDASEATVRVEVLRGPSSAVQDVRQDIRPTEDGGLDIVLEYERRWGGLFGSGASLLYDVRVPHGAELDASTASADVTADGTLGRAKVETASGDVRVGHVTGDLRASSASGDQRVDAVGGNATLATASGSQRVGSVGGDVEANGVSGGLRLGRVAGTIRANTVSGSILVDDVSGRSVEARSVSGSIRIGVRRGLRVWLDLSSRSGSTRSDLEPADGDSAAAGDAQITIRANSVSGSIKVERAAPSGDEHAVPPEESPDGSAPMENTNGRVAPDPASSGQATSGRGVYLGGA